MLLSREISVAARSSLLSRAQVEEVWQEIKVFLPDLVFSPIWVETKGDRDLKTPLRTLEKTDFFTQEIDEMLLRGECRIAIHSAKDLPDPPRKGLQIVAVTKGVDPSDSLIIRKNPPSLIGVSCARREEAVKKLFPHARFSDIRGTIDARLQQLENGLFDAIVVAEAAIIRLHLTHFERIQLDGPTAPLQGKLAVLARDGDAEMKELFRCIDDHFVSRL